MNKRQKKKAILWWKNLDIMERDEHHNLVNPKSKTHYNNPTETEKFKMYNWANNKL